MDKLMTRSIVSLDVEATVHTINRLLVNLIELRLAENILLPIKVEVSDI